MYVDRARGSLNDILTQNGEQETPYEVKLGTTLNVLLCIKEKNVILLFIVGTGSHLSMTSQSY